VYRHSDTGIHGIKYKQETSAVAKMTARCALYKWIEWAVAVLRRYRHSKLSKIAAGRPVTNLFWCNRK